jgi:hypothetical protein
MTMTTKTRAALRRLAEDPQGSGYVAYLTAWALWKRKLVTKSPNACVSRTGGGIAFPEILMTISELGTRVAKTIEGLRSGDRA